MDNVIRQRGNMCITCYCLS